MIDPPPQMKLLRDLIAAASDLWWIVKQKDDYGKTCGVMDERGCGFKPYEDALADALQKTEKALEAAGVIYVWDQNVN